MNGRSIAIWAVSALLLLAAAWADTKAAPPSEAPPMTRETRFMVIRSLTAERIFLRRPLPVGEKGVTIGPDGTLSPDNEQLQRLIMVHGAAGRVGDRAVISSVDVKDRAIVLFINGGPKRKKKWYQRVQVSGGIGRGGASTPPPDSNQNPNGSLVKLEFKNYIPEMTVDQLKQLLLPIFDFNALSAAQAYIDTLPPHVREAIKDHRVLVGMNRDMVIYSKDKPARKIREENYEEWIYGEPPAEVEFVRFVGDEVVRVEVMGVNGEKVVRTEKEMEAPKPVTAAQAPAPARPGHPPTLRRPGEEPEEKTGPPMLNPTNPPPPPPPSTSPSPEQTPPH